MSDYRIVEETPPAEVFCRLREVAGLSPRPLEGVRRALPGSCFGVHVRDGEQIVGMGRIVGDGVLNFDVVDIAVDPAHQGKGLGRRIMDALMAWLHTHAVEGAYISLVADVPALYAKYGFQPVAPKGEGMALVWSEAAYRALRPSVPRSTE
ncbi:GNAT family N-acetyltransferase [Xanthomonas sp. A2111]|uniref:GNAT family N-acetyltransferase n=1 Tax=Xanthomonas hawaiiensis TaxID=3003247 RepID=A0ABU2I6H0_9XANT|nr:MULTISPECIES: GNAT family N-acetyltransferase [unclassified Xanthomonas]MBB5943526.1 GNAT superfamily N-acetyltransferase [Xanthomonas sp. 3307]MBO9828481.1 GNAT family N-acetyltransferase [Xanthomonas sp. A2111]MDS9993228.1 GNAT family N-acetyltransferase [Xanthomonas sp. A2111]